MQKVCGFAGHGSVTYSEKFFVLLKEKIEWAIREEGITEFWVGNYGNFDHLAQRACREVQKEYPHIRICLVLPYLTKEVTENEAYYRERADEIILADMPENTPRAARIIKCNRFMAENASLFICCVSHSFGGAAETMAYAEKKNVKVINMTLCR